MALVDLYQRSVQSFVDRVADIGPDQWDATTPCVDWDVRTLVNHIVGEQLWSVPLFEGSTIAEVGNQFDGDVLGDDAVAAAVAAGAQAQAAVAEPGALDRTVHLSFGDVPGTEYISQLLADHLVHGWDLAVAIGADRTMDPEVTQACLDWFADREALYREGGAIGPAVAVPAGASAQDVLLGAFGRDPQAT